MESRAQYLAKRKKSSASATSASNTMNKSVSIPDIQNTPKRSAPEVMVNYYLFY